MNQVKPYAPADYCPPLSCETPVTRIEREHFVCRFALARSLDSQVAELPGQDAIRIREDGSRLVFALCDGISQSYVGSLGASFLSDKLVDWLWSRPAPKNSPASNQEELASFLIQLVEPASKQVREYPLPPELPAPLRSVLEQRRTQGTEAMFVCGLVDVPADWIFLAWLGNSRLRVWGVLCERTSELRHFSRTGERWSSSRGPVGGDVHTWQNSLKTLSRVEAYSDGLSILDLLPMPDPLDDRMLNDTILDAGDQLANDDISFIEISFLSHIPSPAVQANRVPTGVLSSLFSRDI
jgi:hypothetical protein